MSFDPWALINVPVTCWYYHDILSFEITYELECLILWHTCLPVILEEKNIIKTFVTYSQKEKGRYTSFFYITVQLTKPTLLLWMAVFYTYIVSCAKYFTNFINEFRSQNAQSVNSFSMPIQFSCCLNEFC